MVAWQPIFVFLFFFQSMFILLHLFIYLFIGQPWYFGHSIMVIPWYFDHSVMVMPLFFGYVQDSNTTFFWM